MNQTINPKQIKIYSIYFQSLGLNLYINKKLIKIPYINANSIKVIT